MSLTGPTAADYAAAFERERARQHPRVDALEAELGYALAPERYLEAARVLACPIKANPPSWQHGRVLYAVTRAHLAAADAPAFATLLDIGTAKGYSALCLLWALEDSGRHGRVISLDVIDPLARQRRNTVAELDGWLTLAETLAPWPESRAITFVRETGAGWLLPPRPRIAVAFLDGRHSYEAVHLEASRLAARQSAGDVAIFDDLQIPAVARAVAALRSVYDVHELALEWPVARCYGLARRR